MENHLARCLILILVMVRFVWMMEKLDKELLTGIELRVQAFEVNIFDLIIWDLKNIIPFKLKEL